MFLPISSSGQPKEFWPKPKELIWKEAISAESRNLPKEIFSAERAYFGRKKMFSAEMSSLFRPKEGNFGRN